MDCKDIIYTTADSGTEADTESETDNVDDFTATGDLTMTSMPMAMEHDELEPCAAALQSHQSLTAPHIGIRDRVDSGKRNDKKMSRQLCYYYRKTDGKKRNFPFEMQEKPSKQLKSYHKKKDLNNSTEFLQGQADLPFLGVKDTTNNSCADINTRIQNIANDHISYRPIFDPELLSTKGKGTAGVTATGSDIYTGIQIWKGG